MAKKVAPWPDFEGKPIHVGDTLRHPDGSTAVVQLDAARGEDGQWRAVYQDGVSLWLGNQIGNKGGAIVVSSSETHPMGLPASCGKPLCSEGDHHPLCVFSQQPAPVAAVATLGDDDACRAALRMLANDRDVIEVLTRKQERQVLAALAAAPAVDVGWPPLPKHFGMIDVYGEDGSVVSVEGWTADQLRAYLLDDRATRQASPIATPVGVGEAGETTNDYAAKRLRLIAEILGLGTAIPEKNSDLWAGAFSVLGMIRAKVEELTCDASRWQAFRARDEFDDLTFDDFRDEFREEADEVIDAAMAARQGETGGAV